MNIIGFIIYLLKFKIYFKTIKYFIFINFI